MLTTRQVAMVLNCSMGHVRYLRRIGVLKGEELSSRFVVFDEKQVRKVKREREKSGHYGRGFSPDT